MEEDAKAFTTDAERSKVVIELEELVKKLRHLVPAVDSAVTRAKKDAEEDTRAIEGTRRGRTQVALSHLAGSAGPQGADASAAYT